MSISIDSEQTIDFNKINPRIDSRTFLRVFWLTLTVGLKRGARWLDHEYCFKSNQWSYTVHRKDENFHSFLIKIIFDDGESKKQILTFASPEMSRTPRLNYSHTEQATPTWSSAQVAEMDAFLLGSGT